MHVHAEEGDPQVPAAEPTYVVGIGASAGGLTALQVLLSTLPGNPGFACVIVMHLSPEHESHLPHILQRHTSMPVQQVTSTTALERDHVYVIPPNANLDTIDTHLRLTQLEERRLARAPIDHFMRTLAAAHDGTAIGVILTGAGSDGSIGLRHIKECGGLTIAQDPDEAEFDSMPRRAIATGVVDLVMPVARIGDEIVRFCATRPQLPIPDGNDALGARDDALLGQILLQIRLKSQMDFGVYKRTTLLKRLRRRMQLHHLTKFSEYLDLLAQQPSETNALANDLTLSPTEFFRDTATFLELQQRIIPDICSRKTDQRGRVRVWSIGCSTGEEAYSLAMLLIEECERSQRSLPLQVFASDLSEQGLGTAREGVYPREIGASVSPQRLERFFFFEAGFFRIRSEVRDIVLFASHNLFKDPPFAHIDLIVCRTLLSELQPQVRRGILNLFHYALEPDGILVVGPRDELDVPELFVAEPAGARFYRKARNLKRNPVLPPSLRGFELQGIRGAAPPQGQAAVSDTLALYRASIESYAPANVLINSENTVVHFSAKAAQYVHIPGGEITHDLTRMVSDPIRSRLLEGLHTVRNSSTTWISEPLSVPTEHHLHCIVLHVERVGSSGLVLIVFDEHVPASAHGGSPAKATHTITKLEVEVERLRSRLRAVLDVRPGDAAVQLMRTGLENATEELHSVLEELATSKEELQALNEELVALDDENRRRLRELTQISTDLQHLLASTGVATLFLDADLRIVRFTPLLGDLFGLRLSDIGRAVADLSRLIRYWDFTADARRVLQTKECVEREVADAAGRWYLGRILPYRTQAGRVEGVVLTLIDITERKMAEQALQAASRNKDEFLAVLAHELRNPLAPISSGIQLLKAAAEKPLVVQRICAIMERQAQQLVRLIDDLLEVSRISGGKLNLRIAIISLNDVINDAISSVQPLIEHAGHKLVVNLDPGSILVAGDAARLTQVLSNLLSNAVRYSPRAGTITITATHNDSNAVVTVKDEGIGISPDTLGHIFEMFYQGRNAHPGGAGLGIGLTLAKTLIEMHGGTISAMSEGDNRGSEFKIQLPLTQSQSVPQEHTPDPHIPLASTERRILIVDDNFDAAETLCLLLKSLGQRNVHTASSGAQALETGLQLRPDIVLLDLMMPKMDGYEVARHIRQKPWGEKLLLVALSGWGQEEHRRRSKEAGFDRHVTKPADLAALRELLEKHPAHA